MSGFGDALRECRTAVGLSQNRLAREAGLDTAYVNRLEAKGGAPSRSAVAALGLAVGDVEGLLLAAGYAPAWMQGDSLLPRLARLAADPAARAVLEAFADNWAPATAGAARRGG